MLLMLSERMVSNMYLNVSLSIGAIFFYIILFIIYFSKKKIKSVRTRLFIMLLISAAIFAATDILIIYSITSLNAWMQEFIFLSHWAICFFSMYSFALYLLYLIYHMETKTIFKTVIYNPLTIIISIITLLAVIVIIFVVPYEPLDANSIDFIPGIAGLIICGIIIIYAITCVTIAFIKRKMIPSNEKKGIFFSVVFVTISYSCQFTFKYFSFAPFFLMIIILYLYLNSENPDLLMLEEVANIKKSSEETASSTKYLIESVVDKLEEPFNELKQISRDITNAKTLDEFKRKMQTLKEPSNEALNILDIKLSLTNLLAAGTSENIIDFGMKDFINTICKLTTKEIGTKEIRLCPKINPGIPSIIRGDMSKLQVVLTNLINTSVSHTNVGKIILTFVSEVDEQNNCLLIIKIADTGWGMTEEEQTNAISGSASTGISISKELIEQLGGEFFLQSEKNVGSQYEIRVKMPVVSKEPIGEFTIENYKNNPTVEYIDYTGLKVLICDDNSISAELLKSHLANYHFAVEIIKSPREVIEKIKEHNDYSIIFLDDMMTEMTGTNLLKQIRMLNSTVPVSVYTANAILGMKEKYMSSGFTGYLSKPIDPIALDRIVRQFINKK